MGKKPEDGKKTAHMSEFIEKVNSKEVEVTMSMDPHRMKMVNMLLISDMLHNTQDRLFALLVSLGKEQFLDVMEQIIKTNLKSYENMYFTDDGKGKRDDL